jgi:hypothetical protein
MTTEDDLIYALDIADIAIAEPSDTAEPSDAKAFAGPEASKFGRMYTFDSGEYGQMQAFQQLIVDYIAVPAPARPLCLAIFGPPGSGKSFAAKEICSQARGTQHKDNLPLTKINMTQVNDAESVSRVLARVAGERDAATVPVVFFDEFDAPRDGAPYGWLSWFLAPMHDGEFLHDGAVVRLTRAVFIFAGGTTSTMDDFSAQPSADFRFAKGPDFVSRLRGYLDVRGPNESPRAIRRAIILRNELKERLIAREPEVELGDDAKEVLTSLLRVGRYRHGARSIAAILEMSAIPPKSTALSWDMLPEDHLLKLHVDRGPLDAELLGGPIALSGYVSSRNEVKLDRARDCCVKVAEALWNEGATLAYVLVPDKTENELMEKLTAQLRLRPFEPRRWPGARNRPNPWLLGYMSRDMTTDDVDELMSPGDRLKYGLEVYPHPKVTDAERNQLGDQEWKIPMLSLFRRRFAIAEASVARFVIGGWQKGYKSRVPGIAEEVMLTLAFGRPVYIAGGFDGAASELGDLLGLSDVRARGIPLSFAPYEHEDELKSMAQMFRPSPLIDLPVKSTAIVKFLKAHAIGGPRWPYNGLSLSENKQLFLSKNPEEVIRLVVRGLRKREEVRTSQA